MRPLRYRFSSPFPASLNYPYFYPLKSLLLILYFVCFGCYTLYTRTPDYFDGETSPATIHFRHDSASNQNIPKAVFSLVGTEYAVDARYVFRDFQEGERVEVIYEKEDPSKAAVYTVWGYWIRWQELLGSMAALFVLFQVAVAITNNPTPEAVIEQMEYKEEKKKRYIE